MSFDIENQINPLYVDKQGRIVFIRIHVESSYDENGEVEDEETYFEGFVLDETKALLILNQKKILSTWDMKYVGLYDGTGDAMENIGSNLVRQFTGDVIKRVEDDYFC